MRSTNSAGPGLAAWFLAWDRVAKLDRERNEYLAKEIERTRCCMYCGGSLTRDAERHTCRKPECQRQKRRDAREVERRLRRCQICEGRHFALGLCEVHYNRQRQAWRQAKRRREQRLRQRGVPIRIVVGEGP